MLAIAPAEYGPMPGQRQELADPVGYATIMNAQHLLRGTPQVARARVVAESLPGVQHVALVGVRPTR